MNCCFYIIGDGRYRNKLEQEIFDQGLEDMIYLLGQKKAEDIPQYMSHFDAAFLSFADNPLFEMTIPAKLQSYMACGMPIIAAAKGETARIIREAECGVCCGLGDVEAVVEAISWLMNSRNDVLSMSKNAVLYNKKNFEKNELLRQMEQYIK